MTDKELEGAIIGSILGDSYISHGREYGVEQTVRSIVELKKDIIEEYIGRSINLRTRHRKPALMPGCSVPSIKKPIYTFSASHSKFQMLRDEMYTPKKQVPMHIAEKLTPLGIAIWVMDDALLQHSGNQRFMRICTDSFSEDSIENLLDVLFVEYDIEGGVKQHKSRPTSPIKLRIHFAGEALQKLIMLIQPYILPDFYYKIDTRYSVTAGKILPEFIPVQKLIDKNIKENINNGI